MTYSGGRDIAMEMVKACNDFVLSAVRIAWDGGFYCHEFHGSVEMLFDRLATLWDEYWQKWAEGAEALHNDLSIKEHCQKTLEQKQQEDPEIAWARREVIRRIYSWSESYKDMVMEHLSDEARLILDRWLDDVRKKEGL